MEKNKSEKRAFEIINIFLSEIKKIDSIESIFLIGSLSDQSYTENVGSDIDLVIIINNECNYDNTKAQIVNIIENVENTTNNDIPISKVIYQYKMLLHPYKYDYELIIENKDLIDLPIEVLRIKDSGKCIYGNDISNLIDLPTREDIIKHHELSNILFEIAKSNDKKWYESYIRIIENPNPRMITQIILTNAMSDYYYYTNKNCSSKYRILKAIEDDLPDFEYMQLLQLCHKYRFNKEDINNFDTELMINLYKTTFVNRNKTW